MKRIFPAVLVLALCLPTFAANDAPHASQSQAAAQFQPSGQSQTHDPQKNNIWASAWGFVKDNSALLSQIGGGFLALIVALTPLLTTLRRQQPDKPAPPKVTITDINELSKEFAQKLHDVEERWRGEIVQRGRSSRRAQILTWVTFILLLATLGLYTVNTKARLDKLESDINDALVAANKRPQESGKLPAEANSTDGGNAAFNGKKGSSKRHSKTAGHNKTARSSK